MLASCFVCVHFSVHNNCRIQWIEGRSREVGQGVIDIFCRKKRVIKTRKKGTLFLDDGFSKKKPFNHLAAKVSKSHKCMNDVFKDSQKYTLAHFSVIIQ